jgi:predicted N-acetyltransferase YhbS
LPSIIAYQASHFDGIKLLWRQAFPNDPPKNEAELSFPANLSMQPDLFLVAIDQGVVVGSVVGSIMPGYDGHRGWLYAVAVSITPKTVHRDGSCE